MASDSKSVVISSGLGLPTTLFVVFLVLQLVGAINWPWYAIAAPLLISWGLFIAAFVISFIVIGIVALVSR